MSWRMRSRFSDSLDARHPSVHTRRQGSFSPPETPLSECRVSVCMATYNGERFVREQLLSILNQIGGDDEVVIVDDASIDHTVDIVEEMRDARVRLFHNDVNQGHVRTFENALIYARGRILMLADQDDVWPDDRVDLMVAALERSDLVLGSIQILGAERGRRLVECSTTGIGMRNLVTILTGAAPYFGSAMAFSRTLCEVALPFPSYVEAHDHWLGIVANVGFRVRHAEDVVLFRRLHDANLTPRKPRRMGKILTTRARDVRSMIDAHRRCWRLGTRLRDAGNL